MLTFCSLPWATPVAEHREVRYATPSLRRTRLDWVVTAQPWGETVGSIYEVTAGWPAYKPDGRYAGLWPTKQAAAEVLVKQAGYEVGEL